MVSLNLLELRHQLVEVRVREIRVVENVIAVLVIADLFPQLVYLALCRALACFRHADSITAPAFGPTLRDGSQKRSVDIHDPPCKL